MEYRILGPLQLLHAGQPVQTPTGRPRDLLALLLVEAGRVVGSDRLIDGLWGDALPANPHNALQQQVHQLRKSLDVTDAAGTLATVRGGYQLDVPADAVDAHQFERLAAEGRRALGGDDPEGAVTALTAALALWCGEALTGIDAPWARAVARRLEEQRLAAWEDRIDAELALGRHAMIVGELEQLVGAEPLRERLRGQLVLALAGTGRQADALRVYAEGRELLVEQLGIDPSPQLQQIHADVLAQRVPIARDRPPAIASTRERDVAEAVTAEPSQRPERAVAALPSPASSFVGREEDLERLGALVAGERLVTIVGPGGAGKTRVAIEVARDAAAAVAERAVHYVELASLTEPSAVASTLADGIGAAGSKDVPVTDALRSALAAAPVLLVVDNCEHLLTGLSSLVDELVAACPDLRVLATSREPLGVDGEIVWPLPTLGVPEAGVHPRADVERTPAVRLFLDRARAVAPDHHLDDDEVADVARIVRHLDGLPLAIELAAARMRVLSVAEIAARLHDRFRLLSGGRRSGPDRHRGLWDTLEWSWGLLDEGERRAWMAAAVPSGPFPASLLGALLDAVDAGMDVLDAVTALCDRSLLTVHERAGATRYHMLETLREFGAQRLAEAGLHTQARDAHAQAVEDAIAATDRTTATTWDVDLEAQRRWLPEARAALRWREQRGDRLGRQRLAAGFGWLWYLTALAPEGLRWIDDALGPIGAIDPVEVVPQAVFWAASLRVNEAPEDQGLRWAQLATDLAPDGDRAAVARAVVATHRAVAGDLAGAYDDIHAEPDRDGWIGGYWRLLEGQLLALEGRAAAAQPVLATAERLLLDNGAWFGIWTSATLAQLEQLRGDADAVRHTADRALERSARHGGAPELEVELRCLVALVDAAGGEHEAADAQLRRASEIVERTGVAMSQALVAIARGYVLARRGHAAEARRSLEDGLARHDRAGQAIGRPFALWCLGDLALRERESGIASQHLVEALRDARWRGDSDGVACALEGLAAVCAVDGRAELGARLLGAAEARRLRMGAPAPLLSRDAAAAAEVALRRAVSPDRFDAERAAGGRDDEASMTALLAAIGADA